MIMKKYKLPITGTIKKIENGIISGDSNDPVRIIDILEKAPKGCTAYYYICDDPDPNSETMEIELAANEEMHKWLENELKSVPKPHDLIKKYNFKPVKYSQPEKQA